MFSVLQCSVKLKVVDDVEMYTGFTQKHHFFYGIIVM